MVCPITPLVFHVDLDAFFASVEQLRNPRLRGRPVIVGSGVIASCSYEAREQGLSNGMPLFQAMRLCPDAVVLEGRHEIYRCFTAAIWDICRRYAPAMETFLDEANCDLTGTKLLYPDPMKLGLRMRREIKGEVGLNATLGIARNRMLAKMAAKKVKPDGLAWMKRDNEEAHLLGLNIEDLPGIGHKTAKLMHDMNIRTVREFREIPVETLEAMFGKNGRYLHERARGEDTRPIQPREIPRTISRETTFHKETSHRREIEGMFFYLLERALGAVRHQHIRAKTIRITIRYEDFRQDEASKTIPGGSAVDEDFHPVILESLRRIWTRRVNLRHVGIVLSQFVPEGDTAQLRLFEDEDSRLRKLHDAIDRIRDKYGHGAIVTGRSIDLLKRLQKDRYGYILRTPSLTK